MDVNFNPNTSKVSMKGKGNNSGKNGGDKPDVTEKDISDGIQAEDAAGRASFAILSKSGKPKINYLSEEDAKKKLSDIGMFDLNVFNTINRCKTKNGIDSRLISLAEEFFKEEKIKFGKDYENDVQDGFIPKEYYVKSEKNRTFKAFLDACYKKDGTDNFDEVNSVVDYLCQNGNKRYVDDLMVYFTYGKDSNGDVSLDTVQKVKSIIQPKSDDDLGPTDYDSIVRLHCCFAKCDDVVKRVDEDLYDYTGYNKVLDSIEYPYQISGMNKILDALKTSGTPKMKEAFLESPAEYFKYIANSDSRFLAQDYDAFELPEYDAETLKELNDVYKVTGDDGTLCRGFKVTPENKKAVIALVKNGYDVLDMEKILNGADESFCELLHDILFQQSDDEQAGSNVLCELRHAYNSDADLVKELAYFKMKDKKGHNKYFEPEEIKSSFSSYKLRKNEFLNLINMSHANGSTRFTPKDCVDLLSFSKYPAFNEVVNSSIDVNGKKKYLLSSNGVFSCLQDEQQRDLLLNPSVQNVLKFLPDGSVDKISKGKYFDGAYTVSAKDGDTQTDVSLCLDRDNNARFLGSETKMIRGNRLLVTKTLPDGSRILEEVTKTKQKDPTLGTEIETTGYKKTFFDSDGQVVRSEVLTPAETNGEFILNVYDRRDGKFIKNTVGTVKSIFNGKGQKVERNLESSDGVKTRQVKVKGEKLDASEYVISDKDGQKLYEGKRTHKKVDDNHFVTTVNGQKYTTEFKGDDIIVSKLDNNGKVLKKVVLGSDKLSPEFRSLYEKLPADYLMDIHDMDIRIIHDPLSSGDNAGFGMLTPEEAAEFSQEERDALGIKENEGLPPTIMLTGKYKDDLFVFLHELGHAKDRIMFKDLNSDENLKLIFNSELKDYTANSIKKEDKEVSYFIDREHYAGNSLIELIAESHALLSGAFNPNNDVIGARSIILQKNFPKTIAYIGNAMKNPDEYMKNKPKESDTNNA